MNAPSHQPFALVTDDDAMIRMDACAILEDAGFQALEAATGDEAVTVLEAHAGKVRLLFTDVQMPGTRDGFALARETARRWPGIKVLVASGQMKPQPGELPEGAVFIDKPFSAEVVHTRVKELFPDGERPKPLQA